MTLLFFVTDAAVGDDARGSPGGKPAAKETAAVEKIVTLPDVIEDMRNDIALLEAVGDGPTRVTAELRRLLDLAGAAHRPETIAQPPSVPREAIIEGWIDVFRAAHAALHDPRYARQQRVLTHAHHRLQHAWLHPTGEFARPYLWTPSDSEKNALRLAAQVLIIQDRDEKLKQVARTLIPRPRKRRSEPLMADWRWDQEMEEEKQRLKRLAGRVVTLRMAMLACRRDGPADAAVLLERAVRAGEMYLKREFETVEARRAYARQPDPRELVAPLQEARRRWTRHGATDWAEACAGLARYYAGNPEKLGSAAARRERDEARLARHEALIREVERMRRQVGDLQKRLEDARAQKKKVPEKEGEGGK